MEDYGALIGGIGDLLGGIGKGAGVLIEGQRKRSTENRNRQEEEDLYKSLKEQGYTDADIAIIKTMPQQARGKALLDLQGQKKQQASRSAYQQAVSNLLGKGSTEEQIDLSALSDKELDKLINLSLKREGIGSQDIASRQKTAAPIKKEVIKLYKAGRATEDTLQQLEDLSKSGNLDDPKYVAALRSVGLDNPILMKTDSNVFEKVRNDFLTKLKDVFGGRITNNEIDLYMKGLPDLLQSKEGRSKVIKVMRAVNKGSSARYNALKEIEDRYGDKLPYNLETLIEERASKKLDAISKELSDIHNADRDIKEEETAPKKQFNVGHTLDALPDAAEHIGLQIRTPQGKIVESNGISWNEVRDAHV